jgi:hypothetical protein
MMPSLNSLTPFLLLFSTQFKSAAPKLIFLQAGVQKFDSSFYYATVLTRSDLLCYFITPRHRPHKNTASTVKKARLLVRYLAMDVILLHAYALWDCVYRVFA